MKIETTCDSCMENKILTYYSETDNYHCEDCKSERGNQ
jgi:hypothetical protein